MIVWREPGSMMRSLRTGYAWALHGCGRTGMSALSSCWLVLGPSPADDPAGVPELLLAVSMTSADASGSADAGGGGGNKPLSLNTGGGCGCLPLPFPAAASLRNRGPPGILGGGREPRCVIHTTAAKSDSDACDGSKIFSPVLGASDWLSCAKASWRSTFWSMVDLAEP